MSYVELQKQNSSVYRSGQKGQAAWDNVLSLVNLYSGQTSVPIFLASMSGRDNLSVSVQASYQGFSEKEMKLSNLGLSSSVLGTGWNMPLARIVKLNRDVKESYEADYIIVGEGGSYPLYRNGEKDGKTEFFSVEHPLWKIFLYEKDISYWTILKEDGSTWVYGGTENCVESGLDWDNWVGSVSFNGGQSFTVSWLLREVNSYNESSISYDYENDLIAIGDASYTRSSRLKSVTSAYGEKVELFYKKKESFERQLPHDAQSGENAFQFSFEESYLDFLEAYNTSNELLYKQQLSYEFQTLGGDSLKKRMLKSVTQIDANGVSMTPLTFDYDCDVNSFSYGALNSVKYPTGAATSFAYGKKTIDHVETSANITALGSDWDLVPSHGEDFTVCMSSRENELRIKVMYWDMGWQSFDDQSFVGQSIRNPNIYTGVGLFAVSYFSITDGFYRVRLFKRNPLRKFSWDVLDIALENEPEVPAMACGSDYFAIQRKASNSLEVHQFNYLDNKWHETTLSVDRMDFQALGAGNGFLLGAYYSDAAKKVVLRTFYADENHVWQTGDTIEKEIEMSTDLTRHESVWSVGAGQASATFVNAIDNECAEGYVLLMRWRSGFIITDTEKVQFSQTSSITNPLMYSVVSGSVIGFAQNIFRYSPGRWNQQTILTPSEGGEYRYSYGSDLALAVENKDGYQSFYALRFDPYRNEWVEDGVPHTDNISGSSTLYIPLVLGDYAVLGREVFVRGTNEYWTHLGYLPDNVNGTSLQFDPEGHYIICQSNDGTRSYLITLENFSISSTSCFDDRLVIRDKSPALMTSASSLCLWERCNNGDTPTLWFYSLSQKRYVEKRNYTSLESATLDTGLELQRFYFDYDTESMRQEGETSCFEKVEVIPVDASKSYGYTRFVYFNGKSPDNPLAEYPVDDDFSNVRQYYSHLSGHLYYKEVFDEANQITSGTSSLYKVLDVHGFVICQAKAIDKTYVPQYSDANSQKTNRVLVEKVVETEYEPKFYQQRKITELCRGRDGDDQGSVTEFTYVWEQYPDVLQYNLLTHVVNTKKSSSTGNLIRSEAIRWEQRNNKWNEVENYRWDGSNDSSFQFTETQEGWFTTQKINLRDDYEQIVDIEDALGNRTVTLYDSAKRFPVAEFGNTKGQPVVYSGFEAYEVLESWNGLDSAFYEDECYSGTRCLRLDNGIEISLNMEDILSDANYLLKYALKTNSEDSEISISSSGRKISLPVPDTKGMWMTTSICVDLSSIAVGGKVEKPIVSFKGSESGKFLLDAVFFTPLSCDADADVYSGRFGLKTATHSNRGLGTNTIYDRKKRPVAVSYDNNDFKTSARYLHRAENTDKNKGSLDTTISIEMPGEGSYYSLGHGNDFSEGWNVSGNWTFQNQCLVVSPGGLELESKSNLGSCFTLLINTTKTGDSFAVHVGIVTVQKKGDEWILMDGETTLDKTTEEGDYSTDLMLLRVGNRWQFFRAGRCLLSGSSQDSSSNKVSVDLSNGAKLCGIGFSINPKVSLSHIDYLGRPIQDQAITENGVITGEVIYSKLDQQSVHTKKLESPDAMWGYRNSFITSFDSESGLMEGEVSSAYPGDEGFPYSRSLSTISPAPSPTEFGLYGKEMAIQGPEDKRNTTRLGKYESSGISDKIPSGMLADVILSPDGKETVTVKDALGAEVSSCVSGEGGLSQLTNYFYDDCGRLAHIYYPEYYSSSSSSKKYVSNITYDKMGYISERSEPDSGVSKSVYERNGRLRFIQDARGTQEGWYFYHIYDTQGRETETGMVSGVWDEVSLRAKSSDLEWVPEGAIWKKRLGYDGDGSDLSLLGRLWKIETKNDDTIVEEIFSYDALGNIIKRTQTIGAHTETLLVDYDAAGNVVTLKEAGSEDLDVTYHYDLQGRMTEVLWKGSPVCRYEYSKEGSLSSEIFDPGKDSELRRDYSYNPAQWLISIKDKVFEETLSYYERNGDLKGGHGGQIGSSESTFTENVAFPGGFLSNVKMDYSYDGLGRLTSAICGAHPELSIGNQNPFNYDNNSNLTSYDDITFKYSSGSNRLINTNKEQYEYNANGSAISLTSVNPLAIDYDPVMQNVTMIRGDSATKKFVHGATGICAYTEGADTTYCLQDNKGHLLKETRPDGTDCICLRGANGIFAQIRGGKIFYLVKDHQASVRGIYNEGSLVAAYNYAVFGGVAGSVMESDTIAGLIPIRFTGQILESCGLYRMDRRFYDPVCGRFIGIDPEAQYSSPYIYGGADWVNYFDPDGAWSWAAFGAIIGGIALVVVGAALTVVSGGIASPVGAALVWGGGTFILGAGMAATIYGVTAEINGNFSWKDLAVNMAMGGVFAVIGGGLGSAMPATIGGLSQAATAIVVDIGTGVVVGTADGIVTNGVLNVVHGQNFWDHALVNGLVGGTLGGVFGGLTGIGRSLKTMRAMGRGPRNERLGIGYGHPNNKISHASVWDLNARRGSDFGYTGPNARNIGDYHYGRDFAGGNGKMASIRVDNNVMGRINPRAAPNGVGRYSLLTNNCTSYVIGKLSRADIYAPLWARTPRTLYWWGKLLGGFH